MLGSVRLRRKRESDADAERSRLSAFTGMSELRLADALHAVILPARPLAGTADVRVQPVRRGLHRCGRSQAAAAGCARDRVLAKRRACGHLVGEVTVLLARIR